MGKVNNKNITYGIEREKGIMYAMCKEKISKLNILIALIFPLFFTGIVTYIIGIIINNNILLVLSIINIASASGDIVMFWDILKMPHNIKYVDLDDTTGFTIVSEYDLSKRNYFGLTLNKYGKYDNNIRAYKHKKLYISKFSCAIFIIFLILIIFKTILLWNS